MGYSPYKLSSLAIMLVGWARVCNWAGPVCRHWHKARTRPTISAPSSKSTPGWSAGTQPAQPCIRGCSDGREAQPKHRGSAMISSMLTRLVRLQVFTHHIKSRYFIEVGYYTGYREQGLACWTRHRQASSSKQVETCNKWGELFKWQ